MAILFLLILEINIPFEIGLVPLAFVTMRDMVSFIMEPSCY